MLLIGRHGLSRQSFIIEGMSPRASPWERDSRSRTVRRLPPAPPPHVADDGGSLSTPDAIFTVIGKTLLHNALLMTKPTTGWPAVSL